MRFLPGIDFFINTYYNNGIRLKQAQKRGNGIKRKAINRLQKLNYVLKGRRFGKGKHTGKGDGI